MAMSGGVDSSVAAAILSHDGHDVVGLSMQLYDQRDGDITFGSCCTLDDLHDARRVAGLLGIPHYILNFERKFKSAVVNNFISEYENARTPIPCVHCNGELKFSTLLERAQGLDAPKLATGHYAQVTQEKDGTYALKRGVDLAKDQSYFLFSLTQAQLACASFPLGHQQKSEVRAYAEKFNLPVAQKPDSHELCFVPDGDYASFIEKQSPSIGKSGRITDLSGSTLGNHDGIHRFTIGQRRGLGISNAVPLYVTQLDAKTNTVTVGERGQLEKSNLTASDVNWISGTPPSSPLSLSVQIRHQHKAVRATVEAEGMGRAHVTFEHPQPAITPGQAAVFYERETVIGGGWID